jgi:hypothetical protein
MIILAFGIAVMLVAGSFIGRRLARAREEFSVEFRGPEVAPTEVSSITGKKRWGSRVSDREAHGARVGSMN